MHVATISSTNNLRLKKKILEPKISSFPNCNWNQQSVTLCVTYFVGECVLLEVVRLDELHAALAADVRPDVLVLHHVVLKLARVLERFLALGAPARLCEIIEMSWRTSKPCEKVG